MQKILFEHQIATYQNHVTLKYHHKQYIAISIQLNPAVMDPKGPTIIIHYRRLSAIANIRNKEKFTKGTLKNSLHHWRISLINSMSKSDAWW